MGFEVVLIGRSKLLCSVWLPNGEDAADVRSEAGNTECDPGVFLQPFANAFHALSSFECCFNVRPECPNLTRFGRRLLSAGTGEPCARESNPAKQHLRVTASPTQKRPFLTAKPQSFRI